MPLLATVMINYSCVLRCPMLLNESEPGVGPVLIETSMLFLC